MFNLIWFVLCAIVCLRWIKLSIIRWNFLCTSGAIFIISLFQISLKSDDPRLRYSDETIFKISTVRHIEFLKIVNWSLDLCLNMILLLRTKFHVNRTINRGYIAKIRFSIWRPSTILNLQYFDTLTMAVLRTKICSGTPNFIEIG